MQAIANPESTQMFAKVGVNIINEKFSVQNMAKAIADIYLA
jgi:hypothetical protein